VVSKCRHPLTVDLPGCCHGLALDGLPSAGDTYLINSVPVVPLELGLELTGTHAVLLVASLTWLGELEYAARLARARMSMWGQDHQGNAA